MDASVFTSTVATREVWPGTPRRNEVAGSVIELLLLEMSDEGLPTKAVCNEKTGMTIPVTASVRTSKLRAEDLISFILSPSYRFRLRIYSE